MLLKMNESEKEKSKQDCVGECLVVGGSKVGFSLRD